MCKALILMLLFDSFAAAKVSREEASQVISQYKGVFTSPPSRSPTDKVVDGPLMGNGDLGATVSGNPESQRFWISKCDFWKAKAGHGHGSPMLIGGIDIHIPNLINATYHAEQFLYEPEIRFAFKSGNTTVIMHSWVAALENLLVIELACAGKTVPVEVNLWVQAGHESVTESGMLKDIYWISRKFNGADLDWPSEATVAMRFLGTDTNTFTLEQGQKVTVIALILTNHDTEKYLEDARKRVSQLDAKAIKLIQVDHNKWWQNFWSKSFIEIGDPLIEKFYYGSHYIMACCSRNTNFPPGLFGNWITTDKPAWAGDYHLNYNYEAPWWGVYSSNHVELSNPYDAPLMEFIPKGKEYAERFLACRGVYYPVGIGPKGLDTTVFPGGYGLFLGQKSDALFATVNMFMRFYHTYDLDYARKVYPYLIEVANFWEDYLKFESGRYVIYKDHLYEIDSWMHNGREEGYDTDMNPTLSLGMVRMFFKGLLEISKELGVDADRHGKWRHILTHISKFPMVEKDGRKRFRGAERGPSAEITGADRVMFQGIVFPSGVVGLDSDLELLQMARAEVRAWPENVWINNGNGFCNTFAGAARVGHDPQDILTRLRKEIHTCGLSNLWIDEAGGGIENCAGTITCLNEMLLQSHEKVLRLFPVWPQEKDARFGNLRAVGAFLVSSALRNGQVQYVSIKSEKGRDCTVQNPWRGKAVMLHRNGKETETLNGKRFTFKTAKGEIIFLGPKAISFEEIQRRINHARNGSDF